jgi:hypothetical protein
VRALLEGEGEFAEAAGSAVGGPSGGQPGSAHLGDTYERRPSY